MRGRAGSYVEIALEAIKDRFCPAAELSCCHCRSTKRPPRGYTRSHSGTMAAEQPLPYDLHDSNDLGRCTHVAPSTLTDSEHEVIIEVDSESDVPSSKARKDRSTASLPVNGRKKGPIGKKKAPLSEDPIIPLLSEDLLYHLMDQNKILMDQNKVLTQRLEPSDPFAAVLSKDGNPLVYEQPPMPEMVHPMGAPPCPEPFLPDFAQPVKRKPKDVKEDKFYAQCKELWDVLPRVLRVLEAAAPPPPPPPPPPTAKVVEYDPWGVPYPDAFDGMTLTQVMPLYEPGASKEEKSFATSKDNFLRGILEAERKFGVSNKAKKFGKKAKPKTGNTKLKFLDRDSLMPWAWKALDLLQKFLVVFVMIQLSLLVGGDVFGFFKKSPKNSSWLGF